MTDSRGGIEFEVVPEPSSIAMAMVAGGVGLLEVVRRRIRRDA